MTAQPIVALGRMISDHPEGAGGRQPAVPGGAPGPGGETSPGPGAAGRTARSRSHSPPNVSRGRRPGISGGLRGDGGGVWLAGGRVARPAFASTGRGGADRSHGAASGSTARLDVKRAVVDRLGLLPEDHRQRFREARLGPGGPTIRVPSVQPLHAGGVRGVMTKLVLEQFGEGLPGRERRTAFRLTRRTEGWGTFSPRRCGGGGGTPRGVHHPEAV
uniref:translation initiation factor IF-2-like n=1 Tax=Gasterosteus aculeatus aculeatus TaxID=481459 RepID=UPI001A9A0DB7|nr:translation initiation factor IF-2-like [Gasterosteus aculeatus aculeatus]